MKRFFLLLFFFLSINLKAQILQFDVYATSRVNFTSGDMLDYPSQNFKTLILESNKLSIKGENTYVFYNEKELHEGFSHTYIYHAVDMYKQRCTIVFQENNSAAQKELQWFITIFYENSDIGVMYVSNPPKIK